MGRPMVLFGIEFEIFNACGNHVGDEARSRRCSICRRMDAKSVRGIAASANWNRAPPELPEGRYVAALEARRALWTDRADPFLSPQRRARYSPKRVFI